MKAPADCRLIGRWRIVEADLWDREYLDLCGPATLTVTARGAEITLLQATLLSSPGRQAVAPIARFVHKHERGRLVRTRQIIGSTPG